mmetsp:Transcript_1338/g.3858  ORF Transcript_1338/g.3858 Transcript_1338/m.3858 type:complete len:300 (-) Transcript_1338:7017-7916(-)
MAGIETNNFFGSDSSSRLSPRSQRPPSMKRPWMFCPSSGTSRTFSMSWGRISVCEMTSSKAHWSFLCCRVTSWRMPVKKPWAFVKPVSQYDFMIERLFWSHSLSMTCRSVRPVNQPPRLGISQEISAPLASLVQRVGTRASKIEPRSASRSVVITTVPSMAMEMDFKFTRTIWMMFCKRCSSWNKKMFSGALKPLSGVPGGPLSFVMVARKISSTKSSGILDNKSMHWSLTISSTDFPEPPPVSFGCVSMIVAIISEASFRRYVRSAFECRPKMLGESTAGMVSMASRNWPISNPSGIL